MVSINHETKGFFNSRRRQLNVVSLQTQRRQGRRCNG